jgi:hypothetical protein
MFQEQTFSGLDDENPYHHLREFEQLCACLTISGMSHETLRWKLFPFSLDEKAKVHPQHRKGKWRLERAEEQILSRILPYSNHFPAIRDSQLPTKREGNVRCSLGQIFKPIMF